MEEKYGAIARFLNFCTDLMEGKFNEADTKITELLSEIAASEELTGLFTAVTRGFDYAKARAAYLKFPASKGETHGVAYLPSDRGELLAFVFCLFVEFDAGTLKLGDFLLRYFYVDGSYTASYLVFIDRVVRPFTEIVQGCYPEVKRQGKVYRRTQADVFVEIGVLLSNERARLARFLLLDEERSAADILISQLTEAAARKDIPVFTSLLVGYKYFLAYFHGEDSESAALFALAAKL